MASSTNSEEYVRVFRPTVDEVEMLCPSASLTHLELGPFKVVQDRTLVATSL